MSKKKQSFYQISSLPKNIQVIHNFVFYSSRLFIYEHMVTISIVRLEDLSSRFHNNSLQTFWDGSDQAAAKIPVTINFSPAFHNFFLEVIFIFTLFLDILLLIIPQTFSLGQISAVSGAWELCSSWKRKVSETACKAVI